MEWYDCLPSLESDAFNNIVGFLAKRKEAGETIFPKDDEIFAALSETPLDKVKVVILGQDPYPTPGHAHGLSFSVRPEVNPIPRSLRNIYHELQNDIGCPEPPNGCLLPWAHQGVLLLNTSLTVENGAPGSHSNIGWTVVTNEIIEAVSKHRDHVVFILWGKHAQGKSLYIDRKKHLVLRSAHPSPMSADRGFFGSRPFSQANAFLEEHGIEQIDWCIR